MKHFQISERQQRVLELLAKGNTNKEIEQELTISRATLWRDLTELKETSHHYVSDLTQYFGFYYYKSFELIRLVVKELWALYKKENNSRVKVAILSLLKDCRTSNINLLADGPVVLSLQREGSHEKTETNP